MENNFHSEYKAKNSKKWLTHLIIIGAFIAITLGFLSPMLNGKVLQQHDEQMFSGSAKELSNYNSNLKPGQDKAFWTNSMFGGMPAYQISVAYPKSMFIMNYIYAGFAKIPHPINTVLMYMIGFYIMLLSFRLNPFVAAIGAIAFAFGSYNIVIIDAGHVNKTYAIAFAPLVIGAVRFIFHRQSWILGTALLGLALAFQIKTNHVQITYYLGILIGFMVIYEMIRLIKAKEIKNLVLGLICLAIGGIAAVGSNFSNLYLTNEYVKNTQRGKAELTPMAGETSQKGDGLDKDYALQWSQGVSESWTYLIPNFVGGASSAIGDPNNPNSKLLEKNTEINPELKQNIAGFDQYWGPQPLSAPVYFGAIVMFLFLLGMLILDSGDRWWILAITILATMLSWGKNFLPLTDIFFEYFPLYNKFRSVSMILVLASFAIPLLAAKLLNKLVATPTYLKENIKKFYIAFGVTAGFCLIFWLMPSFAGDFLKPENADINGLRQGVSQQITDKNQMEQFMATTGNEMIQGVVKIREMITREDALRSFIFILLAGGILYIFAIGKIKKEVVLATIAILILVDMIGVDGRYLTKSDFQEKIKRSITFEPSIADETILKDKDPNYRVLNLTLSWNNDASTSYFHKSIGGYHAAKLRRYQDLINRSLSDEIQTKLSAGKTEGANAINMLNTKYIIYKTDNPQGVLTNPNAMGNAWFVSELVKENTPDDEINNLEKINIKEQAIVGNPFLDYIGNDTKYQKNGTISQTDYKPGDITYAYESSTPQFAVFSEIYYNPNVKVDWHKGDWISLIDGKPVDHIRVNYTLRGMKLPDGKHTIEFQFKPRSFGMAENVSFASSILLLLMTAGGALLEWRKRN